EGSHLMMTVNLAEDLRSFVRAAVNSGQYATEDEVMADALVRLRRALGAETESPDQSGESSGPSKKLTKQEFQRHLVSIGLLDQPSERNPAAANPEELIDQEGEIVDEVVIRERLIEWLTGFL